MFPDIHIQGCAFHWGQAVWRHVQKLGLQVFPLIFFKKEYTMYIENVQCYENRKVFRYYHDYENTSNKLTVFE
jgi:hypothetical protein